MAENPTAQRFRGHRRRRRRPRHDFTMWIALSMSLIGLFQWVEPSPMVDVRPAFSFSETVDGLPLRWHTCSEVGVLINPGPTGEIGFEEIQRAVQSVAADTGVRFTVLGQSDRVPTREWARTGDVVGSWPYPPVLIGWVTKDVSDLLGGAESGSAVANPAAFEGVRQFVTGAIAFDSNQLDRFSPGFGKGSTRGNLILHELGHLVGLAHVEGRRLMNSAVGSHSPNGFTDEEREGFVHLSPKCPSQ